MTTQFLTTEGGRIAYDVSGSGPLVICVPSMGDLRQEYRFLAPLLNKPGYRVATMDVRGHGESSVGWADVSVAGVGADIVALVKQLGGPAIVVGTSMAAGGAVWAAAEAPELVRGMVLIGPFVRGGGDLFGALLGAVFSGPWGPYAWLRYYAGLYPSRKPNDFAAYTSVLRANLAEPGRMKAVAGMIRASKAASKSRLPRVSAPALVLMGSKDPDFKKPEAEASWVARALHAEHKMIEGAGHYPHAEFPAETAALIAPFLGAIR